MAKRKKKASNPPSNLGPAPDDLVDILHDQKRLGLVRHRMYEEYDALYKVPKRSPQEEARKKVLEEKIEVIETHLWGVLEGKKKDLFENRPYKELFPHPAAFDEHDPKNFGPEAVPRLRKDAYRLALLRQAAEEALSRIPQPVHEDFSPPNEDYDGSDSSYDDGFSYDDSMAGGEGPTVVPPDREEEYNYLDTVVRLYDDEVGRMREHAQDIEIAEKMNYGEVDYRPGEVMPEDYYTFGGTDDTALLNQAEDLMEDEAENLFRDLF